MDALLLALTVLVWTLAVVVALIALMAVSYLASMTKLADAKAASERRLH